MKKYFYILTLIGFSCFGQVNLNNSQSNQSNEAIPIYKVNQIPLSEDCKNVIIEDQTQCLISFLNKHLKDNLQIPPHEEFKTFSMREVNVSFTITSEGKISDIIVESLSNSTFKNLFEKEIIRVLQLLPKFNSGLHNEKPVNVFFKNIIGCSLIKKKNNDTNQDIIVPYVYVKNVVTEQNFPICLSHSDDIEIQKDCFDDQFNRHIQKNFNYPEDAVKKNIGGKVLVIFVIDKEGNITDIKSKGPENGQLIIEEAERIMKKLPKLVPATINRKPIPVKLTKTVTFKL